MATRLTVLAAALSTAIAAPLVPGTVQAQEQEALRPQPQVDNARHAYEGRVNANNVRVRSGPSENYYETERLPLNANVTIVGNKYEWLKILPPQGSFSVVAKASVSPAADRRTGTVLTDGLSVRAGSKLTSVKVTVQCRLKKGDTVEILGEQDEYYQIKPPAEAFLYVHQRYVDPVRKLDAIPEVAKRTTKSEPVVKPAEPQEPVAVQGPATEPEATADAAPEETAPVVTSDSMGAPRNTTVAARPTTQPVQTVSVETIFDRLDGQWATAQVQSLEQMPVEELLAGYEGILKDPHLAVSMRRTAEVRVASLRIKNRAKQEYLSTMQQQQEAMRRIEALRAQRQIVETRLANSISLYTAVGSLQPSTLQLGKETLYRLTDPSTGRSLCYVRSDDAKFVAMIGRFVAVKGDLANDPNLSLKVVNTPEITPIDPERVNRGITATIVPPSLVNQGNSEGGSNPTKGQSASTVEAN